MSGNDHDDGRAGRNIQLGQQYFVDHTNPSSDSPVDNLESMGAASPDHDSAHQSASASSTPLSNIALKMLVSNNVAGSIIGRAGQAIAELQNQSKCRVKLSQADDCYPGTSDRVCLLQGEMSNILYAIRLILAKFRHQTPHGQQQHSDSQNSDEEEHQPPSVVTVRVPVPNSACGMLIGRGGSHIKSIAEKSHARIQLAQKEEVASVATNERLVTVTGDIRSSMSCITMILEGIAQNPELYKYSNMTTSYSKTVAASTNAFSQAAMAAATAAAAAAMASHQSPGAGSGSDPSQTPSTKAEPPHGGYTGHIYGEDTQTLLASAAGAQQSPSAIPSSQELLKDYTGSGTGVTVDQSSTDPNSQTQLAQDNKNQLQSLMSTKTSKDGNVTTLQIAVPDSLVGGILGRGGSGIAEIQICSGTKIKVSERGDFVPGTTNRTMTISGSEQACTTAHFLISQRMAQQVILPEHIGKVGSGSGITPRRRRGRRGKNVSGGKDEGAGASVGDDYEPDHD